MPNKILRPFQRRKSSVNVLEEVQNPPESSFRVFERPSGAGKSFDGGAALRKVADDRPLAPRKNSLDGQDSPYQRPGPDETNRGSNVTQTSLSAGANGSTSSSFRLSTSSTNASSIGTYSEKNGPIQRPFNDIPVPPPASARPSFAIKNALRVSSFGLRMTSDSTSASPQLARPARSNVPSNDGRDRAASASTASTATPPKLHDSDLSFDGSELDNFGNMFDNIGRPSSPEPGPIRGSSVYGRVLSPASPNASPLNSGYNRDNIPMPLKLNNSAQIDSSPFSWHSEDSEDRLIRSPSPSKTVTQDSPYFNQRQDLPHSQTTPVPRHSPIPHIITPEAERQNTMPIRRKAPPSSFPNAFPQQSLPARQNNHTSPKPQHTTCPEGRSSSDIDPSLAEDVGLATRYEEYEPPPPKPPNPNKVMTRAQFEKYREQKERDRSLYGRGGESDSDGENEKYEDEDEIEKARKATQQRRKQEAQLAIYRQSMMKVTGEKGGSRPGSGLSTSDSRVTLDPRKSGPNSADEEEDEDVPLGILAAHGFPNKNRPPTRLAKSPSNSNLGAAGAPPPSVAGESTRPGNLPVFARNLPPDPYFGAGLVNPSNREFLAMNGGASVYDVTTGPATGPYPVHPSGLVGVIAGEERARAMRRGSPNAQGTYDVPGMPPHPEMIRSQTMGNMQHPGMVPAMLTPGEQAQIQMSQQMNQMMQMQMQWMQQMQQMQQMVQMQGGQFPPGISPEMMAPPALGQRPQSTPLPEMSGQRSMSMSSGMNLWNRSSTFLAQINAMSGPGYAPSLAPSERSNVGLASRYRPVSMVPDGNPQMISNRSSTFTSSTARPWTSYDTSRRSPTGATIRTVNPPAKKTVDVDNDDDDDDEEEGWAEMKVKRDKKQKRWRLKKAQTQGPDLRDLVHGEL